MQLVNKLSEQLAPKPVTSSLGSVHCLLLQLVPTAKAATPSSMGRLKLTWRRRQPAAVVLPVGAAATSTSRDSAAAAATAGAPAGAAALAIGALPAADVDTHLDLPAVLVQDSLVTVRAAAPQHVTAGLPFAFTMQVRGIGAQLAQHNEVL